MRNADAKLLAHPEPPEYTNGPFDWKCLAGLEPIRTTDVFNNKYQIKCAIPPTSFFFLCTSLIVSINTSPSRAPSAICLFFSCFLNLLCDMATPVFFKFLSLFSANPLSIRYIMIVLHLLVDRHVIVFPLSTPHSHTLSPLSIYQNARS